MTASNSRNKAWSSVIQRSADAGSRGNPGDGDAGLVCQRAGSRTHRCKLSSRRGDAYQRRPTNRCTFRARKSRSHRDFGQNRPTMRWPFNCHPTSVMGQVLGNRFVPHVDGLQPSGEFDSRTARQLVHFTQLAHQTELAAFASRGGIARAACATVRPNCVADGPQPLSIFRKIYTVATLW